MKKRLETQIQTIRTYSEDIMNGNWLRKMCHVNNEKQKKLMEGIESEHFEKMKSTSIWEADTIIQEEM